MLAAVARRDEGPATSGTCGGCSISVNGVSPNRTRPDIGGRRLRHGRDPSWCNITMPTSRCLNSRGVWAVPHSICDLARYGSISRLCELVRPSRRKDGVSAHSRHDPPAVAVARSRLPRQMSHLLLRPHCAGDVSAPSLVARRSVGDRMSSPAAVRSARRELEAASPTSLCSARCRAGR